MYFIFYLCIFEYEFFDPSFLFACPFIFLAFNSPLKKINLKYSLPLYLFPFSLLIISIINGINPFTNMSAYDLPLKLIIWSSYFTVSINYISSYEKLLKFIKVIVWANLISIAISIFSILTNNTQFGTRFWYWIGDRYTLNPNYVAIELQLCILFIWLIVIIEKKLNIDNKKKYIQIIILFICITLWTQSKTAIYVSLIILASTFFMNLFSNSKIILKIRERYQKTKILYTYLSLTLISAFLFISGEFKLFFLIFISRFENNFGNDFLSKENIGRDIIREADLIQLK